MVLWPKEGSDPRFLRISINKPTWPVIFEIILGK
jgi:hypothetical protein